MIDSDKKSKLTIPLKNNTTYKLFNFNRVDVYSYCPLNLANDCYKMATLCYDNFECHCAYSWYNEVHAKYNATEKSEIEFDYPTFTIQYIWSAYLIGE